MSACQKNLSITINPPATGFEYWDMEEAAGNRIDAIQSAPLVPGTVGLATVSRVAGIVNFGVQLQPNTDSCQLSQTFGTGLDYTVGVGITVVGWFNYDLLPDGTLEIIRMTGGGGKFYSFAGSTFIVGTGWEIVRVGGGASSASVPAPTAGVWNFFILEYIPGTGLRIELNRDGVFTTDGAATEFTASNVRLLFSHSSGALFPSCVWDEIGFWPLLLTNAQKDYLFNGGMGRGTPIVLP